VLLDARGDNSDRSERPVPAMAGAGAGDSRSFHRDDLDDEIPF
jgi:hypothetical protein